MPLNLQDALLAQSGNLPDGDSSPTLTGALNLGLGVHGETAWRGEFEIDAPALATGALADTKTITYDVLVSANSDMSSPTVLYSAVLKQTGAGGAGAPAAAARFRLPFSIPLSGGAAQPYLAIRATNSYTGDCSASAFTLNPMF